MKTAGTGLQRLKYMLGDYVMLNAGWLVFTLIRYAALPAAVRGSYTLSTHLTSLPVLGGQIVIPLVMIGLYWLSGYYNNVYFKSRMDEVVNTAGISLVGTVLIFFIVLVNDSVPERLFNYEMLGLLWLCLLVPVLTVRVIITNRAVSRIRRREIVFNTLIVGTGQSAVKLADRLMHTERHGGFNIVGLVETREGRRTIQPDTQLPVYVIDQLADVVRDKHVARLIVMPHHDGARDTGQLINSLFPLGCSIYISPELQSFMVTRPRLSDVAGEPLINISDSGTPASTVNCKRLSDIVLSAITLVVLSPVLIGIGIAVALDSRGSVIFSQERIGYHKRPFRIYKFRTMRHDAEANGPALSSLDDPRITRIGHLLRKYRLDELPQFWNVVKGDMSLVGPRPERDYYIRQIVAQAPYYSLLHQVRPGITSWGMVKYGYATSVPQMIERLRYDMLYINNVSLAVDIKILFYTVNTVFTGKGL